MRVGTSLSKLLNKIPERDFRPLTKVEAGKARSFQVTIGYCVACIVSSEDEWGLWMGLSGSREREKK